MSETRKPKERSSNFSNTEIDVLVNLVKNHQGEVNCNKTGHNKQDIRKEAWLKIAQEFNSRAGVTYRSANVLKTKYKNIKCTSAKKFADVKANYRGTGGGPGKKVVITDLDETIKEIHGPQVSGLESKFDDDRCDEDSPLEESDYNATVNSEILEQVNIEKMQTTEEIQIADADKVKTSSLWTDYTPAQLQQPVSEELTSKRKDVNRAVEEPLKTKIGRWAKTKVELSNIQKEWQLEQHNLKIKHMKEKHAKEIELLIEESRTRRLYMKQEHEARMKLIGTDYDQMTESNLKH